MALLSHPKIPRPHHKALSSHSPPSPPHPLCSNVSYPLHPCPLRCVQLFLFALPVLWHILTRSDTRAGRASRPSVENWDRVVTQLSQLSLPAASADASFEWLESASAQSHSSASPTSPSTTFTSDLDVLSPSSSSTELAYPDSPASVSSSDASLPSSPSPSSKSSSSVHPPSAPRKKTSSRRAAKDPNHIPRPPNAFIIFRSKESGRIKQGSIEKDHRIISQIVGKMWKKMGAEDKKPFVELALDAKREHLKKYPNYRFAPKARTAPAKKRKVKRNTPADKALFSRVADCLIEGKSDEDVKAEVAKFDSFVESQEQEEYDVLANGAHPYSTTAPTASTTTDAFAAATPPAFFLCRRSRLHEGPSTPGSVHDEAPFRSPLLPPVSPSSSPELQVLSGPLSPLELDGHDAAQVNLPLDLYFIAHTHNVAR